MRLACFLVMFLAVARFDVWRFLTGFECWFGLQDEAEGCLGAFVSSQVGAGRAVCCQGGVLRDPV